MWIRTLELTNWMPFRGETRLQLEPKPYAIVARRLDNADSSNWCGKSSIPEAVYFALTGRLNPDRQMGADGWITDLEKYGEVKITFDTGDVAKRSRKVGKSTQFHFNNAKGEEAQALLLDAIGVTPDDFLVTCYFQQRHMARLVLAEPRTRMEYVSAWFQLKPLEDGEEHLRAELARRSWESESWSERLAQLKNIEASELGTDGSLDTIHEQVKDVQKKIDASKGKLGRLQDLLEKNQQYVDAPRVISEYEELKKELRDIEDSLSRINFDEAAYKKAEKAYQSAHETFAHASRDRDQKQRLAAGQFDGHCPVALIECPVTDKINASRQHNERLFEVAENLVRESAVVRETRKQKFDTLQEIRDHVLTRKQRQQDIATRLARMRLRYEEAKKAPPAMDADDLRSRIFEAQRECGDLEGQLGALRRSINVVNETQREMVEVNQKLNVLAEEIVTHREALVIFGKQGAQRRVAENALARIQGDANEMLQECGINLEVDVSWSREGTTIAKTCDTCGHPFPPSAKVKVCERCHAQRGLNQINKLDLILSEQSGAAEDLASSAVQLAASAWLRAHRGVRWETAMLDEPLAFCDRANRRALSTYLARMLTRPGGFSQAFIISHTSDTDAYPGLIEVLRGDKDSSIKVLA